MINVINMLISWKHTLTYSPSHTGLIVAAISDTNLSSTSKSKPCEFMNQCSLFEDLDLIYYYSTETALNWSKV